MRTLKQIRESLLSETDMTDDERKAAIQAHLAAHDKKMEKRKKALVYRQERKKKRGLDIFVQRMKDNNGNS
jgi:hypothetical protein